MTPVRWVLLGGAVVLLIIIMNVVAVRARRRHRAEFLASAAGLGFRPLPEEAMPPGLRSLVLWRRPQFVLARPGTTGDTWVSWHHWTTGEERGSTRWDWLTFMTPLPGRTLPDFDVSRRRFDGGPPAGRGRPTGDTAFDQGYLVNSSHPDAAAALGPRLRRTAVTAPMPDFGVRDGVVWIRVPEPPAPETFPRHLQALAEIAAMLRDAA
jgi:hypothetical protein